MSQMSDEIRVGFLLDSFRLRAWEEVMIREILGLEGMQVVVVVLDGSHQDAGAAPAGRFRDISRTLVYRVYSRIDRALFTVQRDLFERNDGSGLFEGIPRIKVMPSKTLYSDYISGDDVLMIQQFKPDVLIRLGFRVLRGPVLNSVP